MSKLVLFDGENISERHDFTPIMTIHDSCPVIENLRVNHSNKPKELQTSVKVELYERYLQH